MNVDKNKIDYIKQIKDTQNKEIEDIKRFTNYSMEMFTW